MKHNILLRKDKVNAKGEHPIVLCLTENSRRKYFGIGITCHPQQWDEDFKKVRPGDPDFRQKNWVIEDHEERIEKSLKRIRQTGRVVSMRLFLRFYNLKEQEFVTIDEMFEKYIQEKNDAGSYGGGHAFKQTLRVLKKHVNGSVLQFDEIEYNWLKNFELSYLRRGCTKTTVGIHLRHLRVMFNEAIRRNYLTPDQYPFRQYRLG